MDIDSIFKDLREILTQPGAVGAALRSEVSNAIARVGVYAANTKEATRIQALAAELGKDRNWTGWAGR